MNIDANLVRIFSLLQFVAEFYYPLVGKKLTHEIYFEIGQGPCVKMFKDKFLNYSPIFTITYNFLRF